MGSLVLYRDTKERNVLYIVDGQQRLTTITLALSVIRDRFDELNQTDLAAGIQKFLISVDVDNKQRFILEHDPPNEYLQSCIQERPPENTLQPESGEQTTLQDARSFLAKNVNSQIVKIVDEKRSGDLVTIVIDELKRIRDNILNLQFISIALENDDDAYLIFETLNTRGKDLQVSDLLKNHFTRLIPAHVKGADATRSAWNKMVAKLNSVSPPVEMDDFIVHFWLATQSYVSRSQLFREMKRKINKTNAKQYLASMGKASEIYVSVVTLSQVKWNKEEKELQNVLNAVSLFRVAQALPLLLAIMQKYRAKRIKLKAARLSVELIERFTFQFNAITQSRGGGGIANMYAKLAQRAYHCVDEQEFASLHGEMKEKFRERVPSASQFAADFINIKYTSDYTRYRGLIRYIIKKISKSYGLPKEINEEEYTIEHLLSEGDANNDERREFVGALGNLIFVPESVNQKLAKKKFSEKLDILKKEGINLDNILLTSVEWDAEGIRERSEHLAGHAQENVWKI